jgi:hypothetical protein
MNLLLLWRQSIEKFDSLHRSNGWRFCTRFSLFKTIETDCLPRKFSWFELNPTWCDKITEVQKTVWTKEECSFWNTWWISLSTNDSSLKFLYMGELRSYCTVAFPTRKNLYLIFYSTNLDNFFFKMLHSIYPTYRKNIKFFGCRDYGIFKQERSKWVLFGAVIDKNHFFCIQFWLDKNNILQPFCS